MHFVALFQSAQNRDRVVDARLVHHHGLEAPFQRGVFLDVFSVLIERGRADRAQLAAREHRLEHIRRIHRAFGRTRADDRVQLVDEQNDLALGVGDFFQKRFQSIFKFAAEFCARDHRADVHRDDPLVFERIRDIAADDATGETFNDCGLAHAGITDEHGIIFRAAREHLHDPADLVIAADDRIDLAAAGQRGQVASVFLERLIFAFRVLIGHTLRSPHLLQRLHQFVARDAEILEDFCRRHPALRDRGEREQIMLGAGVFVLQLRHLALGGVEDVAQIIRQPKIDRRASDFRKPIQLGQQPLTQPIRIDPDLLEQRLRDSIAVIKEREQEMFIRQFLMVRIRGQVLRRLQALLHFLGEALNPHTSKYRTQLPVQSVVPFEKWDDTEVAASI